MTEDKMQEYIESLQSQIVEIINKVKEESGIDIPVDVQVRGTDDE